jgi:sulfite exporter TauE/SafE
MTLKKQRPYFVFSQRAVIGAILACLTASIWRQSDHQLWQDILIIIGGLVIGVYGLLLVFNWRGISTHYSMPTSRLSPRHKRYQYRFIAIRLGGALLVLSAIAAISSSIFWVVVLFNSPA